MVVDKKKSAESGIVRIRLNITKKEYNLWKEDIINDFSKLLDLSANEIEIISIEFGCVIITMKIPEEKREELYKKINDGDIHEELDAFRAKYNVSSIKFYKSNESPYILERRLNSLNDNYKSLTWLHISDIHINSGTGSKKWNQDIVLNAFINDLPGIIERWNLKPDFIFITGDISHSGDEKEYNEAEKLIEKLHQLFNGNSKFFLIPGNHDVTWGNIMPEAEKALRKNIANQNDVNKILLDSENLVIRKTCFLRQDNYIEFIKKCERFGHPRINEEYFFHETIEHLDIKLGIVGINTAWLSTRKDNKEAEKNNPDITKLIIGEHQIIKSVDSIRDTSIKIALLHHPPMSSRWFSDFDITIQTAKLDEFTFLLNGHVHSPAGIEFKKITEDKSCINLTAGALYKHPEYPNNFNIVKLNLEEKTGIVYWWRYFPGKYVWRPDTSMANEGLSTFNY